MDSQYARIEQLCSQHGTNLTAMCRQLGIARSALSELHAGRTKSLSSDSLQKIAGYFGTSVDYLIGGGPQLVKHWSPDFWEDWEAAQSDDDRRAILRQHGWPEALRAEAERLFPTQAAPAAPNRQNDDLDTYLEALRTRPEMKMLFSLTKNATREEVETAVKIIEAYLGNEGHSPSR